MTEPNHDLTDSEAQAFQPEPHVMHLLQRAKRGAAAPPPPSSDVAAGEHGNDASGQRHPDGPTRGR
jgi:hypothetical protein